MLRRALPIVLAVALVAIGFTQLGRYNVTWDEALGDLFFGQRYLSYLTSFDAKYLDFDHDPYPAGYIPDLNSSEFSNKPWEYWPVANVLAAATSRLLSNGLRLVDPFDGFHAFNLFAAALLLVVLYRFVERQKSTATAIAATGILFLMPRIVCDLMANIKDFPEMVFFALALITFFFAYERGSFAGVVGSGLLWGLAIGTKANGWFAAFVAVAYAIGRGLPQTWRTASRATAAIAAATGAGMLLMIAAWPYLWRDPVTRLMDNFNYLVLRSGATEATINPWFAVLMTTPPILLIAFASGLPSIVRGALRREPFSVLLSAWLVVLAIRISMVANFDGVRHFLEFFPALAIVAAVGTVEVASWIASRAAPRWRSAVLAAVVAVPIATTAVATIRSHPFQTAYWNAFAGGLGGAQARDLPQSCDYWAASYRDGLAWTNANAPRGSLLMVPIAGHAVRLVAPLRLRHDIRLVRCSTGGGPEAEERRLRETRQLAANQPLYVMFIPRREWATELDRDCLRRLTPARAWTLDGAPVLLIYRY
jgi:MFS family permease